MLKFLKKLFHRNYQVVINDICDVCHTHYSVKLFDRYSLYSSCYYPGLEYGF